LIVDDPEFLKKTASYLYTVSGYGSDNEELLQDWRGTCPFRHPNNLGWCEHCWLSHHALESEDKCNCELHKDVPSIYRTDKI
jgi:hypothetical protein